MRRFFRVGDGRVFACVIGLLVSLGSQAFAEDKANQITVSGSWREDRTGESAIYLHNFSGNLNDAGPIMRLSISNGDDGEGGGGMSVDLLPGYQFVEGDWRVRAYAGVIYVEGDSLDESFGAKVLLQVSNKRSSDLFVSLDGSYDTNREMGGGSAQLGGHLLDVIAGPEVGVIATDDFTRTRLGLFVTDFKFGPLGMTVRGGYSFFESDTESKGSPYVAASATLQY